MIEYICIACLGTGDGPVYDIEEVPPPPCEFCEGMGSTVEPGTALVHLPHEGSDRITAGYVYERLHIAQSFRDGWDAVVARYPEYAFPRRSASYAEIRDYLREEFDTDAIVSAMCALYLTRESSSLYWLSFHASFYECEVVENQELSGPLYFSGALV